MTSQNLKYIGSGNGLLPYGTKLLPDLVLTNYQWGHLAIPPQQLFKISISLIWVWELLIQHYSCHFQGWGGGVGVGASQPSMLHEVIFLGFFGIFFFSFFYILFYLRLCHDCIFYNSSDSTDSGLDLNLAVLKDPQHMQPDWLRYRHWSLKINTDSVC